MKKCRACRAKRTLDFASWGNAVACGRPPARRPLPPSVAPVALRWDSGRGPRRANFSLLLRAPAMKIPPFIPAGGFAMMRKALAIAVVLLLPLAAQAESKLLRHPSYSKGKIAFSYLGSIWTINDNGSGLQRLTVN